ncbi:37S ribosomal protein MRP17, mitochondrial [Psilocybe cubensis]|uniref:Ribosomal protein S6 n=2 Tax=Psilocybe cubensis TaxID=181762 RepID=A0A8H8CPH8_PSICU|nr:37S ribosomal protein MRP17, mitochondrial [Psilocybe cubensis]KAH9485460.1 37S ribosomal protein MRP17, mitochondrial [Psilocybe cubensis]
MPLYEMLCITSHIPTYKHIRELVGQAAMHIMNNGGVVRNINSWGTKTLPQRMKRHGSPQSAGDYWTLHFDSSPRTLRSLNGIMRSDPRVLRWTVLKLADRVEDLSIKGEKVILPHKPTVQDIID